MNSLWDIRIFLGLVPKKSPCIILRIRTAWWIPKATDTHSEYVIRIAFPLQQWLRQNDLWYILRPLSVLLNLEKRQQWHIPSSFKHKPTTIISGMILTKSFIYSRGSTLPRHLVPLSRWGNWSWYDCRGVISCTVQKVHLSQGNHHAGFWTSDHSPDTGQAGCQIPDLLHYLQHITFRTYRVYHDFRA
jgi:hypothetical protein